MKRLVSGIMHARFPERNRGMAFIVLLLCPLFVAIGIQPVKAPTYDFIYVRADGSIDPPTAPISREGDVYTLTASITDTQIVIEKDNVIVDGAGYTLQGTPWGGNFPGIILQYRSNVTVRDASIENWDSGIFLHESSNNSMSENNIANCHWGICLNNSSSRNSISGNSMIDNDSGILLYMSCNNNSIVGNNIANNNITNIDYIDSTRYGIALFRSSNNSVAGNNIANARARDIAKDVWGVILDSTSGNSINGNNIANNDYGIGIARAPFSNDTSARDTIYHNNFLDNANQVLIYNLTVPAIWDDDYPSGGNYWSGLRGVDERSGPNQDELGSDGIIDTPYAIDGNNTDHYPLTIPFGPVSEYAYGKWIESPNYTPLGWRNVTYIVIHVMDGYIGSAINWFKNPASNVSAHYLISQEGEIVQMVREKDIAWHAGNWAYNQQSIGIEHEDQGNWNTPNWVPEKLYQTSATLVRKLCEKYGIPKDRAHIIGHTEVPGVVKPCPGPYWDWGYFMGLVNETLAQRTFVARWNGTDYPLSVLSNSTASDFIFSQQPPQISINFTAPSGAHGFCNLTIPKSLLRGSPWAIEINGNPLTNFTQNENMTHSFLSFTFTHSSTVNVRVKGTWAIPEFPSFLILPSFFIATLLAVIIYRRKQPQND